MTRYPHRVWPVAVTVAGVVVLVAPYLDAANVTAHAEPGAFAPLPREWAPTPGDWCQWCVTATAV